MEMKKSFRFRWPTLRIKRPGENTRTRTRANTKRKRKRKRRIYRHLGIVALLASGCSVRSTRSASNFSQPIQVCMVPREIEEKEEVSKFIRTSLLAAVCYISSREFASGAKSLSLMLRNTATH